MYRAPISEIQSKASQPTEPLPRLAWVPIPAFMAAIAALYLLELHQPYPAPELRHVLSFVFRTLVPLFISFLIARSFLARGHLALLLLGCGLVSWACAALVGGFFLSHGPNANITIYNSLVWVSAALHLGSALLVRFPLPPVRSPGVVLAPAYTSIVALAGVVVMATLAGWIPDFFVVGQGGTPLRQVVLGSAILMFFLTALLMWRRRSTSRFSYWYALGLALLATGLLGVMMAAFLDSVLNWTGRAAQFLGGLYMLAASLASIRETREWEIPLEEALSEVRQQYATLVETCPDAIAVHIAGTYAFLNPAALRLFGATHPNHLIGRSVLSLVHPDDRHRVAQMELADPRKSFRLHQFRMLRMDDQPVHVEAIHSAILFGGRPAVQVVLRDITERKQAEDALREAKQHLELRVQERTVELSQTVEQLQNEVARRTAAEETLRKRSDQLRALASELTLTEQRERRRLAEVLHDDLQQYLVGAKFRLLPLKGSPDPTVSQASQEMEQLIDQSIACSRTLTGELSPPILHHAGLVPALEWLVVWMRENHGVTVDLQADATASPESDDIKILLFQSARELLLNAAKHAKVETVQVELKKSDHQLALTVSDRGAGFDPLAVAPQPVRSSGFGLFSIGERLDLLGGKLVIESAPGRGSRFTLLSPLQSDPPPAIEPPTRAGSQGRENPAAAPSVADVAIARDGKIRVLLVDDHPVFRHALSHMLSEEDDLEIVAEASDGVAAIQLARQHLPDVVTMDISMPGVDGMQATRAIHAEFPEMRVIGLSMFTDDVQAQRMRDAGAVNCLTKGGPVKVLLETIRGQ
jgi:PAS domain S-box-containing protein